MTSVRLSVIVPTYNRAPVLAMCLNALREQSLANRDYEVLVIDDGSSDETASEVEARADDALRYLRQENSGANAARNLGIEAARGEVLLFINDDTIATSTMLAAHMDEHERFPDDRIAVLGRVTASKTLPHSRLAKLHLDRAFDAIGNERDIDWRGFLTCNISVKKSLLVRGGVFEERMRYHEDLELGERLSHHGLRVRYRPDALGYHEHLLKESEFLAIAAREARALAMWFRISPHLGAVLAGLGFEPTQPPGRRLRNRLVELVFNRRASPLWRALARNCPDAFERFSLEVLDRLYRCEMRRCLRRELSTP